MERETASPIVVLGYMLGLTVVGLGLGFGGPYLLVLEVRDYADYMNSLPPLFTRHTGITAMYAMPIAALAMFLMAGMGVYRLVSGKNPSQRVGGMMLNVAAVLLLVAVAGVVGGRFVANYYWAHTFQQAGYARCGNSFMLTSRWFTEVWVLDVSHCRDREVRAMMASPRHGIDDINEYLREQER